MVASALLVAGCGGSKSPEDVVRSWSKALNSGDNDGAADLFAANAKFVAGDSIRFFRTHEQAVAFNASVDWCGPIVRLAARGAEVMAQFALVTRATGRCDSTGGEGASVFFRIRDSKIVLFDQVGA
jgi:hypothetical protein